VLTPKELALTAASDGKELPLGGNGQAPNLSKGAYQGGIAPMPDPFGVEPGDQQSDGRPH
jgi:hypothetical protein